MCDSYAEYTANIESDFISALLDEEFERVQGPECGTYYEELEELPFD